MIPLPIACNRVLRLKSVVEVEELVVKLLGLGERIALAEERVGCRVDNWIIFGEGPLYCEIDDCRDLELAGPT